MPCSSIRTLAAFALLAVLAGCGGSTGIAEAPACRPSWHAEWNGDSTLALCLPADFTRQGEKSWARLGPNAVPRDVLTVEILQWPEDSASLHTWPPQLAHREPCYADCGQTDSVTVHTDQVAGISAHTETALLSGGFAGFRRKPVLVMGWTLSARHRGFAQALVAHPATLDSLREAVRSLRVGRGATAARAAEAEFR